MAMVPLFWGVQLEKGSLCNILYSNTRFNQQQLVDQILLEIDGEEFTEFYNRTEGPQLVKFVKT